MPHSASCVNPNPVYSCMILGALIAGDVPAFCLRSCKIRFDARVRIICRCSRMPRSASCLNPKLVYCSMIFSTLLAADVPALCFHSCKIRFGTRIRSRLRGGGGGGGRIICCCSRMPRSASCLNPKLVYCSMIFSALLAADVPVFAVLAHGFAADCVKGGGGGAAA